MKDRIKWWGTLDAAVFLTFKSNKSDGAHPEADPDELFEICNQSLYFWEMKFDTGDRVIRIFRRATKDKPRFRWSDDMGGGADDRMTYTTDYHSADEFNAIFDAYDAGTLKLTVTLKVWYHAFFRHFLHAQRRQVVDAKNFANSANAESIRKSAVQTSRKKYSAFVFEEEDMTFFDVPAEIKDYEVENRDDGFMPAVRILVHLRTQEDLGPNEADEFAEIMVACDWTKLNGYGRDGPTEPITTNFPPESKSGLSYKIHIWEYNLKKYFFHYTNLERGRKIYNDILADALKAAGPDADGRKAVAAVGDGIDKFMITSNHWGYGREDEKGEEYQLHVSNIIGSIHGSSYRASPVYIYRGMKKLLDLSPEDQCAFILCTGTGHCNEHGLLAFRLLSDLHDTDLAMAAKLNPIILSGNANIDHVFVVAGLPPGLVVVTKVASMNNSAFTKPDGTADIGKEVQIWDLRSAIRETPRGSDGYVCDAYLSRARGTETTKQLLKSILGKKGKATEFIRLSDWHPKTAYSTFLDVRKLTSVKNI